MKRWTARWTTAIAAAALLTAPSMAFAQTSTAQTPPATASAQEEQPATPQDHLRKAEKALNDIPMSSVSGPQTKARLNELKNHLSKLERAAANQGTSATGTSGTSGAAAQANVKWETEVAAIDRTLTQLLGSDSTTGAATGTTGTTGSAASAALDPEVRSKLTEFRTHITAFAAAMGAPGGSTAAPPAAAQPPTSMTGTAGATGTTGTEPPTSAAGMTGTAGAPPQTGAEASQPQVDPNAAKQYLTEARNALSEMTQLPAASQLTGDARTQVTQLISNFNELITTNTQWRASYAKVEANLTALIGSETTDESAARTGATGSAGAVGTSGSVSNLDPAIRAKLVEFRSHMEKFEKAAGGARTPESTAAGASAQPGTASAPPATGAAPPQTGAATPATEGTPVDREELLRHVRAIEALLAAAEPPASATTGTTGTTATGTTTSTSATQSSVTLTPAQVDQLKNHLNELKRLLNER
jgi:hypothetical protein